MFRVLQQAIQSLLVGERPETAEAAPQTAPDPVDGMIAVRSGRVEVTNPSSGGLYAVLVPGDDVVVTVDGERVSGPVAVWAEKNHLCGARAA